MSSRGIGFTIPTVRLPDARHIENGGRRTSANAAHGVALTACKREQLSRDVRNFRRHSVSEMSGLFDRAREALVLYRSGCPRELLFRPSTPVQASSTLPDTLELFIGGLAKGYARRKRGIQMDVADIAQELRMAAIQIWQRFRVSPVDAPAYFRKVLKNKAAELFRHAKALKRSGRPLGLDDLPSEMEQSRSRSRRVWYSDQELVDMKIDVAGLLPRVSPQIECVARLVASGASMRRAADVLGVPQSTLRGKWRKAWSGLRD